jgi:tetratricopeptide (TPR) repeat protein
MTPRLARPASGRVPAGRVPASRFPGALHALALVCAALLSFPAFAAEPEPATTTDDTPAAAEPPTHSTMDGGVFYDVLRGEMEAQAGNRGVAVELYMRAAQRTHDDSLFRRAVETAVEGRDSGRALAAAKAWRTAMPESVGALSMQVQLLVALDRPAELAEPLRALIQQQPPEERSATITSVPRFLGSLADKPKALATAEQALSPFAKAEPTRTAVRTALGRLNLAADQPEAALTLVRRALADEPAAPGPVLLALDLMPKLDNAEALVQGYLSQKDALPPVRLAYARTLDQLQRIGEGTVQMRKVLAQQPELAAAWLSLGASLVDLRENREAIEALDRYVALAAGAPPSTMPADADHGDDAGTNSRAMNELAYLLLAQAHEQAGDDAAAGRWLDKIEPSRIDMPTLVRRASLMTRHGQVEQARTLVREAPARDEPTARTRLLAETQVLREAKRWAEAYELLLGAMRRDPEDTVLMYELAMVAERLNRYEDMEALLRRVITLKPDDHQAHNALGYSLADRNTRLEEALGHVQQASQLAPRDPFIIDSLGWVEFRLGHRDEALKLLRRAYLARPHVEVAAHLGEVLWSLGQQDEARRVWRDGRAREADNDVLKEALTRLKVGL